MASLNDSVADGRKRIIISVVFVGIMFAFAIFSFFIAPENPNESLFTNFQHPSADALLGGDYLGRDVLSRVLYGGLNLAWMAPIASAIGVTIGAAFGIFAAYYGGAVDIVLMRIVDVLLAFPAILFVLLFVSMLGPNLWLITVLVGFSLAPGVARVIRGAAMSICRREYVMWATAAGFPSATIVLRDIIPNLISPLVVEYGIRLMWAIGGIASISFLGYGVQAPTADWGLMISENKSGMVAQPLAVVAPMLAILLFSLACNLFVESFGRKIART